MFELVELDEYGIEFGLFYRIEAAVETEVMGVEVGAKGFNSSDLKLAGSDSGMTEL